MPYTIIKDYINKKGFSHQAHFSPGDKYIGPVTKFGSVSLSLSIKPYTNKKNRTHHAYFTPCNKYVEPVEPVVEPVSVAVVEPVSVAVAVAVAEPVSVPVAESVYLYSQDESIELDITLELEIESDETLDKILDESFMVCLSKMKYDELSDEYERLSMKNETTKMKYVFQKMEEL